MKPSATHFRIADQIVDIFIEDLINVDFITL